MNDCSRSTLRTKYLFQAFPFVYPLDLVLCILLHTLLDPLPSVRSTLLNQPTNDMYHCINKPSPRNLPLSPIEVLNLLKHITIACVSIRQNCRPSHPWWYLASLHNNANTYLCFTFTIRPETSFQFHPPIASPATRSKRRLGKDPLRTPDTHCCADAKTPR